jgi:Gpi18-like mannosyltransferase
VSDRHLGALGQRVLCDDGPARHGGALGVVERALLGHYVLAGVLVSLAACVAAACLLYELARYLLGDGVALRSVVFLGVFPYALFLQTFYSEGLFLALALGTFLAAVLARLPLLTRPTGAVMVVALAILAWRSRDRARALAWPLVVPLIFALYRL